MSKRLTTEKIFEIYKKFIGEQLDVFGIKLEPKLDETGQFLDYNLYNPKDLPYSKMCLKGYIEESFEKFKDFTGQDAVFFMSNKFDINCDDLYINDKLHKLVDRTLDRIDSIYTYFDTKLYLYLDVEHVKTEFSIEDSDMINIKNFVQPIRAYTVDSTRTKKLNEYDLEKAVKFFEFQDKLHRFDDTERNYLQFDNLLNDFPTLVDADWQVNYTTTKFINPNS